jgi:hypothetical protein
MQVFLSNLIEMEINMVTEKKVWAMPKLTVHGSIDEITLGLSDGDSLDATFPIHTPKRNLTFS